MFLYIKTDKSSGWTYSEGTLAEMAQRVEQAGHKIEVIQDIGEHENKFTPKIFVLFTEPAAPIAINITAQPKSPFPVKAALQNIDETSPNDWDSAEIWDLLKFAQTLGIAVTVTGVDCEVDGEWDHDYFSVELPSGITVEAVSGIHLRRLS